LEHLIEINIIFAKVQFHINKVAIIQSGELNIMTIKKPYYRTYRQFVDGSYANNGNGDYVNNKRYASSSTNFIRAFELIQKDFIAMLDFIEPSDNNLDSYSFRNLELILRACVEFETNSKAILSENGYFKELDQMNIIDFHKLEETHFLSQYKVKLPYWDGNEQIISPFKEFSVQKDFSPYWYRAYNTIKHERANGTSQASLRNVIGAVTGTFVMLSAQFGPQLSSAFGPILLSVGDIDADYSSGIGSYFGISFPSDVSKENRYDFSWSELKNQTEPFQKLFGKE
jgi:hypothetical protein